MTERWITAKDLYNYTKCHHRVYLDANGDLSEKGEVSSFGKLLWEMGLQTETDYLKSLSDREVKDLSPFSPSEAWTQTLKAMMEGHEMIYQGCLVFGQSRGRPDLLVRLDEGESRWGPYLYEPIDIKAGHGWEDSSGKRGRFKIHYAFQILFYRELLAEIQGALPKRARIINVDQEIEEFDPEEFEDAYRQAKSHVKQLINGDDSSEPILGSHCSQCEWFLRCRGWVKRHQDPTSIFFVGKIKFNLKEHGLKTVPDLAQMNISNLLESKTRIPRLGRRTLERIKERARVVLEGKPKIRSGFSFRPVDLELFFDIEDDPTRGITYLYGLLERRSGKNESFHYILAKDPTDEEKAVRELWEYFRMAKDVVIYVYSHKERTTLRKLMNKYNLDPDVFRRYTEFEFDLYKDLVVEFSDWPTFSYGIKYIAAQIGFSWRDPDPSGVNSIIWYNNYLTDPSRMDLLERILQYNEDDCRAMVAIKDFFQSHRESLKRP